MPKIKTKTKLKTVRPSMPKKQKAVEEDMTEEEVLELQEIVLSKPDATAKPQLNTVWPVLLVVSILTCIGIPFIPAAERVLLGSFVLCAAIFSTYKIFKFEKDIARWYMDNPEFAPKSKKKRTRTKSPSGKPVLVRR